MRKPISMLIVLALLLGFMTVPVWSLEEVEPEVIEIEGHRKRFDDTDVDAIQRYLLIDVRPVDVLPVDEDGNSGDGTPDIEPVAVLLLFPGGTGRLNLEPGQRNTGSKNFVVRTRYHFAAEGFVVAVVDAASDFLEHGGLRGHRLPHKPYGDKYLLDLEAVITDLRSKLPDLPLWAVGTSRGTISAAVAAAELVDPPDGIVLTSSLTGPSQRGDLSPENIDLGKVQVPCLIVTHQDDGGGTRPEDSKRLKKRFTSSPRVQVLIFEGGSNPLEDTSSALSAHGYFGIEQKVIDSIARWIREVENQN